MRSPTAGSEQARVSPCLALRLASAVILIACMLVAKAAAAPPASYSADFDLLMGLMENDYAYLKQSGCNTRQLRTTLRPGAVVADSRSAFVPVLERALECLHDSHAHLGTNLGSSTRLIPSGLEVWAEWRGDQAVITQVRPLSPAQQAGVRSGDRIVAFDGVSTADAVDQRMPCCVEGEAARRDARQWALLALLAGRHDHPLRLTLEHGGVARQVDFRPGASAGGERANVQWRRNADDSGYIAVNDLGDSSTVAAFDAALAALHDTRALFLDLRNTPAGGNTDVAEPILGRLLERAGAYQRIEPLHGPSWLRRVEPRGPWTYRQPVTVLVSRWTGSMGEGMAIGLDALGRADICGSAMAGLKGAVFEHTLPVSGITVRLPGQRLSHVDGRPRETFLPKHQVGWAEAEQAIDNEDWISRSLAQCRAPAP